MMNAVDGFLIIVTSIYNNFMPIKVPGFDFTFGQLLIGVFLMGFIVQVLRFLLGLPFSTSANSMKENFKKSYKNDQFNH